MNLGKLAKTVKKVVDSKGDKIAAGVDKATDFVDKKTKGKFHDKLEKVDAAAEKLDKTTARAAADTGDEAPPPPPAAADSVEGPAAEAEAPPAPADPPSAAAGEAAADDAPVATASEEPPAPSGPPA